MLLHIDLFCFTAPATNPSPSNGSLDGDVGRDKRYYFYPTWGRRFYWRNRLKLSPWWSSWWDTWDGWYDADVWNRYDWGGLDWWNDFYAYGKWSGWHVRRCNCSLSLRFRFLRIL